MLNASCSTSTVLSFMPPGQAMTPPSDSVRCAVSIQLVAQQAASSGFEKPSRGFPEGGNGHSRRTKQLLRAKALTL